MNCYDCATIGHPNSAVATCIDCGAGLCAEHVIVVPYHLTRVEIINRRVNVEPPARLMHCETCSAAHRAVAQGKAS